MKTRIPLPVAAFYVGLLAVLTAFPASAGGTEHFEPIDSEAMIEKCWALSKEDRDSGVTGRMRSGAANTIGCLEKVVLDQLQPLFPDGKYMSRKQAREHLDRIRIGVQKLYWSIYNEHVGCDPFCGTIYQVFHLSPNARILEDMIRALVRQRKEYGL